MPENAVLYVAVAGVTSGPFTTSHVAEMIRDGSIKRGTFVSSGGEWVTVESVAELRGMFYDAKQAPLPNGQLTGKQVAVCVGLAVVAIAATVMVAMPGKAKTVSAQTSRTLQNSNTAASAAQELALAQTQAMPSAAPTNQNSTCNASDLWFNKIEHDTDNPGSAEASFLSVTKSWSPECRAEAFNLECKTRCDDFLSGLLMRAASAPESLELRKIRHSHNRASLDLTEAYIQKVSAFTSYANSIKNQPRPQMGAATGKQFGECNNRMVRDYATVRSLMKENDDLGAQMTKGVSIMADMTLSFAQSCVSCDPRHLGSCNEMNNSLERLREVLKSARKLVSDDSRYLHAKKALP